jgi:RNA polymerase sigma-70 factor (ECF subfamily)
MHTTPVTLLERLRHAPDEAAWQRLVKLYTPLLFFWARRAGESEHDAADLVQDVLTTLVQELPRGRDKGIRFRAWLHTVTLNKLRDRKRRAALARNVPLDETFELALPDDVAAFWDAEYRQQLARRALQLMQTDFAAATWKACWATAVEGRPVEEVAQELGISENAVYIAKCRVLHRLQQELAGLLD